MSDDLKIKIAEFRSLSPDKRRRVISDLSGIMKSAKENYAEAVAASIAILETIHKDANDR